MNAPETLAIEALVERLRSASPNSPVTVRLGSAGIERIVLGLEHQGDKTIIVVGEPTKKPKAPQPSSTPDL